MSIEKSQNSQRKLKVGITVFSHCHYPGSLITFYLSLSWNNIVEYLWFLHKTQHCGVYLSCWFVVKPSIFRTNTNLSWMFAKITGFLFIFLFAPLDWQLLTLQLFVFHFFPQRKCAKISVEVYWCNRAVVNCQTVGQLSWRSVGLCRILYVRISC